MLHRKAYKFQLEVDLAKERLLNRHLGCCRYVWNKALSLQKERVAKRLKNLTYAELCKELTQWRRDPETIWLLLCPAQVLQQTLKQLDRAYKNFFEKRALMPRFKKRGRGRSQGLRFPQGFKIDEANVRLYLPKVGWINYRKSQAIQGEPKNVSVRCLSKKWYVSIQTQQELNERVEHPSKSAVGIDVGIARFATLSDGEVIEALNSFRQAELLLGYYQRALARKQKGSKNWRKQREKISRLHERIANRRRHFLHEKTTMISKTHAMIVIEDLSVKRMSASASGTLEEPGRNVRAKSGLNKAILDQGWGEFRRQLEYKQAWRGGMVVVVPPQNTSRRCAECQHVARGNRTSQAHFECESCGHSDHADCNAAQNILAAGYAVLACGIEPLGKDSFSRILSRKRSKEGARRPLDEAKPSLARQPFKLLFYNKWQTHHNSDKTLSCRLSWNPWLF